MDIHVNQPKFNTQKNDQNKPSAAAAGAQFKAMFKKKIETLETDSVQETEREEQPYRSDQQIKITKVHIKPDTQEDSIDKTLEKIKDRIKTMLLFQKK